MTSLEFRFDEEEEEWEEQRDQEEEVLTYDDGVTGYESSDEEPWRVTDYSDPTDMGMKVCDGDENGGSGDKDDGDPDYDMDAWKDVGQSWDRSGW